MAVKLADFEAKFASMRSDSIQTELTGLEMVRKEAEYERCIVENSASKQNVVT